MGILDTSKGLPQVRAVQALALAVQTPGPNGKLGLPVMLMGPPGVAKTAYLVAIGRALGYELEVIIASIRDTTDFLGLPYREGGRTHYAPPDWAAKMRDLGCGVVSLVRGDPCDDVRGAVPAAAPSAPSVTPLPGENKLAALLGRKPPASATVTVSPPSPAAPQGLPPARGALNPDWRPPGIAPNIRPGLVFFDEFSTAPKSVQGAMLRVINERWVGDLELPASVAIAGAMNPASMAAGAGDDLSAPAANRFCHIAWPDEPDVDAWTAFIEAVGRGEQAPVTFQLPFLTAEAWRTHFGIVTCQVAAFMRKNPANLYAFPSGGGRGGSKASKAWPSPRSWELATRALAAGQATGMLDAGMDLANGAVGPELIAAFTQFVATDWLVPGPTELLRDTSHAWLRRNTTGRTTLESNHLRVGAINAVVAGKNLKPDEQDRIWDILTAIYDATGKTDKVSVVASVVEYEEWIRGQGAQVSNRGISIVKSMGQ